MEQNKLNFILIALNIIIFVSYFAVSNFHVKQDMSEKLKKAQVYTVKEDWEKAKQASIDIEKEWNENKVFIMTNYGESEFGNFEGHINGITGGIESKSIDTSLTSILSAQDDWKNLNKIIPFP